MTLGLCSNPPGVNFLVQRERPGGEKGKKIVLREGGWQKHFRYSHVCNVRVSQSLQLFCEGFRWRSLSKDEDACAEKQELAHSRLVPCISFTLRKRIKVLAAKMTSID